jgi:hypothetical protein
MVKNPSRKGVKDGKQGHVEADLINVKVRSLIFNVSKYVTKADFYLSKHLEERTDSVRRQWRRNGLSGH